MSEFFTALSKLTNEEMLALAKNLKSCAMCDDHTDKRENMKYVAAFKRYFCPACYTKCYEQERVTVCSRHKYIMPCPRAACKDYTPPITMVVDRKNATVSISMEDNDLPDDTVYPEQQEQKLEQNQDQDHDTNGKK